jgi:PadR family transcriptional regulator, regulatory protein PadR
MQVSQELIKGTVIPVVLALLKDRPRYGYEMVQLVNARTNGALNWSEGTLYPVLHKLEADRLVQAEWRDEAGRRRRYYALSAAGRRELKRRTVEWKTFAQAVGDLLERTGPTIARVCAAQTEVRP